MSDIRFFDLTIPAPPCAIIIGHAAGLMFDPARGLVYRDSRFATVKGQ